MVVRFEEIIYNSIITLSVFNFYYLYMLDFIYNIHHSRYTYPLLFVLISRNYVYENITKNKQEIECYTSCIHASILALSSILYLVKVININYYSWALDYSVIYNIIDVYYLFQNDSRIKYQMLCHHCFIVVAIIYRQLYESIQVYNYYIAMNFLSELTTVPLNMSWLLYLQKKKNTFKFKVTSMTTLCLYLPFRVILNTYLFYDQLTNIHTPIIYLQGMLMLLNYFWFYKLCRLD